MGIDFTFNFFSNELIAMRTRCSNSKNPFHDNDNSEEYWEDDAENEVHSLHESPEIFLKGLDNFSKSFELSKSFDFNNNPHSDHFIHFTEKIAGPLCVKPKQKESLDNFPTTGNIFHFYPNLPKALPQENESFHQNIHDSSKNNNDNSDVYWEDDAQNEVLSLHESSDNFLKGLDNFSKSFELSKSFDFNNNPPSDHSIHFTEKIAGPLCVKPKQKESLDSFPTTGNTFHLTPNLPKALPQENESFHQHIYDSSKNNNHLKQENANLLHENSFLREKFELLNQEHILLCRKNKEYKEKNENFQQLNQESILLCRKNQEYKEKIEKLRLENTGYHDIIKNFEKEHAVLLERLSEAKEKMGRLQNILNNEKESNDQFQQDNEILHQKNEVLSEMNGKLEHENTKFQQKCIDFESMNLLEKIESFELENIQLTEKILYMESTYEKMISRLKEEQAASYKNIFYHLLSQNQSDILQIISRQLDNDNDNNTNSHVQKSSEIKKLKSNIEELQSQIDILQEERLYLIN